MEPDRRAVLALLALAAAGTSSSAVAATSDGVGLSKRELEREAKWMTRASAPSDPDELRRHIIEVVIALIDKNNQAIAAGSSASGSDIGADF